MLVDGPTEVHWVVVEVRPTSASGATGSSEWYQVPVALSAAYPSDVLDGGYLGTFDRDGSDVHVFDALAEPAAALALAAVVTPAAAGQSAARPVTGGRASTSVVLGDRFVLKVFRRLEQGANPDVELTTALAEHGFGAVPAPVEVWRRNDTDLGVLRRHERTRTDGAAMAAASLEELFDRACPPRDGKLDMVKDSRQLGTTVADLHVALAESMGFVPAPGADWAATMAAQLHRVAGDRIDAPRVEEIFDRLRVAPDLGAAIRIHGDLDLAQALRLPRGWLLIDFEGEPERPVEERRAPSSPLRDVAGMMRSYQQAASVALRARDGGTEDERVLARAWAERNMNAFLAGYAEVDAVHPLLPRTRGARDALLSVFELDKAVYDVAYELAHRPELVDAPVQSVSRLVEGDPPLPDFPPEP